MQPAMTPGEIALLKAFQSCSQGYLEFGCGGSTVMAADLVQGSIIALDSHTEWLGHVREACLRRNTRLQPVLFHADIGPVGDFGVPARGPDGKPVAIERWPNYYTTVWTDLPSSLEADLILVDGRFRVACFIQSLLRVDARAILMMHDFANRPVYHGILEFAREVARIETISAFVRRADFDPERAAAVLAQHRLDGH